MNSPKGFLNVSPSAECAFLHGGATAPDVCIRRWGRFLLQFPVGSSPQRDAPLERMRDVRE